MNESVRERELAEVFTTLADTLVAGYDVVDLLQHLVDTCVALLDADAGGLLLAEPSSGVLELVASTSEEVRIVELLQLGAEDGPCIQAFATGTPVVLADVGAAPEWPAFRATALEQGFRSATTVPMRLREQTIGALGLFRRTVGALNERDLRVAQALANVATIGIMHARALAAADVAQEQLQRALHSRVVIEQAKGVLAHSHGESMDEAFARLRDHARSHRLPLADVALGVVERRLRF